MEIKDNIIERGHLKILQSPGYNYIFNKQNGVFLRWGNTQADDPAYSPFGPEILDIEVTTKCNGVPGLNGITAPCKFCYKGNGPEGENMSLETFKKVIDRITGLKIKIQLEDGSIKQLDPYETVLTTTGQKLAKDISFSDDIQL